jgi:phosphotransferase system  glucose/maltose/N-acetylglucosamine-specific IIC component
MRDDSLLIPAIAIFAVIIGFVAWPFIAIFIQELGHALAAKLVGLAPAQMVIGHPDENDPLFSFRCFGCSVQCWPIPFGGATIFLPPPTDRSKTFIIALGGPVFDALVIFLCILLWQHTFLRFSLAGIILCQALNALRNLAPVSSLYDGARVPSDGKVILQLLARKRET